MPLKHSCLQCSVFGVPQGASTMGIMVMHWILYCTVVTLCGASELEAGPKMGKKASSVQQNKILLHVTADQKS